MDYDSLVSLGAMMGSGGLIVMDEETCMVDIAKFFLEFTQDESCGKCVPCREGTKAMLDILDRITRGEGQEGDIELLEELGNTIKKTALCGLGQTAPNPVLSTLRYFRDEYEAHVREKRCPAGVCRALAPYVIHLDKCRAAGVASRCARWTRSTPSSSPRRRETRDGRGGGLPTPSTRQNASSAEHVSLSAAWARSRR